jgi:DNA-binding response OmpR family regulator
MRILLVEDDRRFGQILKLELERDHHVVELAPDGVEGVLSFMETPCDLILIDIRMPRLGGIDALRIIRKLDPKVPAIVFSAVAGASEIVEAELAGAVKFLNKPFEFAELKHEIAKLDIAVAPPGGTGMTG